MSKIVKFIDKLTQKKERVVFEFKAVCLSALRQDVASIDRMYQHNEANENEGYA